MDAVKNFVGKLQVILLLSILCIGTIIIPRAILHDAVTISRELIFFILALGILLNSFFPNRITLKIFPFDLIFIAWVGWHFVSLVWAKNESVVLSTAFNWLYLLLFYGFLRTVNINSLLPKRFSIVFIATVSVMFMALLWFYYSISISGSSIGFYYVDFIKINGILGSNQNYIASILVLVFPIYFLIMKKWEVYEAEIFLFALFHLGFVLILNCRAASIVICVLIGFFYLFHRRTHILRRMMIFLPLMAIPLALFMFLLQDDQEYIKQYNPMIKLKESVGDDRLRLISKSTLLIKENPILGVGNGNWVLNYPKYGVGDMIYSFNKDRYFNHPHIQLIHVFAELGLIGALFFIGLFVACILQLYALYKKRKFTIEYQVIAAILFAYAMLSCFYGIVYSKHFGIVVPELILVACFALIHREGENGIWDINTKGLAARSFILVSLMAVLVFKFSLNTKTKKMKVFKANLNSMNAEEALLEFNSIYNKNYFAFDLTNNKVQALKCVIAEELWKKKAYDMAIVKMKEGIGEQPFYFLNYYKLAEMHMQQKKYDIAKLSYQRANELNNSAVEPVLKLIEIAAIQNNENDVNRLATPIMAKFNAFINEYDQNKQWQSNKKIRIQYRQVKTYMKRLTKFTKNNELN